MTYRESIMSFGFWVKFCCTFGFYIFWWLAKNLTIDSKRVTLTSGVLSKDERSMMLDKVTDVRVQQGMLGRMLGYGTVRVESAGSGNTEIVMHNIAAPNKIKKLILR